jgi:ribulose-phosphate 3-epimerase
MTVRIHPSILSADFVNFERDFETISNCDSIHIDVMDGHFVPNLTFGLPMVARMQQIAPRPLDVHLMIENVDTLAERYADTGVDSVTFHAEASNNLVQLARQVRGCGAKVGVAVKPSTSLDEVLGNLLEFDMVLVMTVEPGFGGQPLIESCLQKVRQARAEIDRVGANVLLQVDGGIDENNIARVSGCGADTFVAGSAVFGYVDRAGQIDHLREKASHPSF